MGNSQFVNIPDWDKSEVIDMTELFHDKKIKQRLSDCKNHRDCQSDSYSKGKGKGKGSSKRSRRSQSNGKQKEKGSYSHTLLQQKNTYIIIITGIVTVIATMLVTLLVLVDPLLTLIYKFVKTAIFVNYKFNLPFIFFNLII